MRPIALLFASAVAVAFACGGQVDEACPASSDGPCLTENKTCDFPMMLCGYPETATCACHGGQWQCPLYGCPAEVCPADTHTGVACSSKGMHCASTTPQPSCTDVVGQCTCDGTQFQCDVPDCPPPPECPPPDAIAPGESCVLSPDQICQGSQGTECVCQGTWQCESSVDAGAD